VSAVCVNYCSLSMYCFSLVCFKWSYDNSFVYYFTLALCGLVLFSSFAIITIIVGAVKDASLEAPLNDEKS